MFGSPHTRLGLNFIVKYKKQKQEKTKETKKEDTPTTEGSVKKSGKQTLIYLERSDLVRFDNENLPDIQVLVGNVVLRHDDVFLYCDSAHMNQQTNSFKAFGHVKIEQGDSLWSIAEEYCTDAYEDTREYVDELKELNSLTSDIIHEGQHLLVAYYDAEIH